MNIPGFRKSGLEAKSLVRCWKEELVVVLALTGEWLLVHLLGEVLWQPFSARLSLVSTTTTGVWRWEPLCCLCWIWPALDGLSGSRIPFRLPARIWQTQTQTLSAVQALRFLGDIMRPCAYCHPSQGCASASPQGHWANVCSHGSAVREHSSWCKSWRELLCSDGWSVCLGCQECKQSNVLCFHYPFQQQALYTSLTQIFFHSRSIFQGIWGDGKLFI